MATVDPAIPFVITSEEAWDRKTILSIGKSKLQTSFNYAMGANFSLDGGGIRAFSALITLNKLFELVARIENGYTIQDGGEADLTCAHDARPCLYFDYIAGTGTGGLLAILLGRLRMNLNDATSAFENVLKKVYQPRRIKPLLARPLYDAVKLEKNMQEIVRQSPPKLRRPGNGSPSSFLVDDDTLGELSRT
jgi:Patatin-like phospholipase